MAITTEQIKALRDQTGVSVMKCKTALEEAGGDQNKAIEILQQKSKDVARKKQDRVLNSGVVRSYIHSNDKVGVLLELNCETDFVARNEDFLDLAYQLAMHIAAMNPTYLKNEEISEADRQSVSEMYEEELADKPAEVKEKALTGKIKAYFAERVLLEQSYIKDSSLTIGDLIESANQKFGERIEVSRFVRFEVGKE